MQCKVYIIKCRLDVSLATIKPSYNHRRSSCSMVAVDQQQQIRRSSMPELLAKPQQIKQKQPVMLTETQQRLQDTMKALQETSQIKKKLLFIKSKMEEFISTYDTNELQKIYQISPEVLSVEQEIEDLKMSTGKFIQRLSDIESFVILISCTSKSNVWICPC